MLSNHPVAVSVIVPNYNHAEFLDQRLKSVFDQSYKDYEVIILDDCSSDHSRKIIEQYRSHPKVAHIFFNEYNSGSAFKQWEKGFKYASGEFIWIAESDDWCDPDFLDVLIKGIHQTPSCGIAFAQSVCVDAENRFKWETYIGDRPILLDGRQFIKAYMTDKNSIVNASMAIFRKSLLTDIPANYTSYYYCGDWLFWIELAMKGSVYIYDKPLNYYRKHENDVTGKALASGLYIIEEARLMALLYHKRIIDSGPYHALLFRSYGKFLHNRKKFDPEQSAEIIRSFRSHFKSRFHFILFSYEVSIKRAYRLIRKFITNAFI